MMGLLDWKVVAYLWPVWYNGLMAEELRMWDLVIGIIICIAVMAGLNYWEYRKGRMKPKDDE